MKLFIKNGSKALPDENLGCSTVCIVDLQKERTIYVTVIFNRFKTTTPNNT